MLPSKQKLLEVIGIQTDIARLGLDLSGVMNLVAQKTLHLVDAGGSAIELAEGEEMVYRAAAGAAESSLGLRLDRATSLSGLCVARGEMLRCDDAETDARVDREACRRVGLRSMIVMPLKHGGVTVGVLKAMSATPGHFGADDIAVLDLLSEVVGAAMYHSTRYASDDLFHKATHDSLTGLANRSLFMDRLHTALSQSQRDGEPGGLLIIDMDGLKQINDSHGHRAGDKALIELGQRLSGCARASDTVARLGGDEFAMLLRPVNPGPGIEAVIARLSQQIATPFRPEGLDIELRASIGAAVFMAEGADIAALVELADQRMYAHKRRTKAARAASAASDVAAAA